VRHWLAAALLVGAAFSLAGCAGHIGASPAGAQTSVVQTTPLTFSITTTTPTDTVATPTSKPYIGPEGLPMETGAFLAPATTTRLGAIVRGIQCQPMAQLAYTSYAHLQIYIDGRPRALPGGIGLVDENPIPTRHGLFYGAHTCMYWLHTRAADGLVEVQSPIARHYTLGDLFAVWDQPLSRTRVAGLRGHVTATVNGRHWPQNPQLIPLDEHESIELAVGSPEPPAGTFDWVGTNF
jgi:hypothetical protein